MEVIDDTVSLPSTIDKVLFCTGKIYYNLIEEKEKLNSENIAVVRVEQLYPFPQKQLFDIKAKYFNAKHWLWVQEEPENMGAWGFMRRMTKDIPLKLCAARPASGSPATGSSKLHKLQQQRILDKAFGKCTCEWALSECDMFCVKGE